MRAILPTPLTLIAFLTALSIGASACSGGGSSTIGKNTLPSLPAAPGEANATASNIVEFPIVSGDSGPMAIALAPDGNPWFLTNNAVNRMTMAGSITQFTRSDLHAYNHGTDIILGPGGGMWFTANCAIFEAQGPCGAFEVLLMRSSTSGAFTVEEPAGNTLEQDLPSALASGGDNTIWLVLDNSGTPNSALSAYQEVKTDGTALFLPRNLPLPPTAVSCGFNSTYVGQGIARGSDGAMYVAARTPCDESAQAQGSPSAVIRVDSFGDVTNVFPVPHATRIAAGSDGNLWITQGGSTNAIGRLTTSGTLTEYPIPTANAGPAGITLGNDGNVWFAESDASKIGRITPDGNITEFITPTSRSGPYGIASLPGECGPGHGDIWFTEAAANKIGRMQF